MGEIRGHKNRAKQRRSRRHRSIRSVFLISMIVICFALAVGVMKSSLKKQELAYAQQEQELTLQIESEKARTEELDQLEEYVASDQYVEDTAREKLGMAYPNDLLLKAR